MGFVSRRSRVARRRTGLGGDGDRAQPLFRKAPQKRRHGGAAGRIEPNGSFAVAPMIANRQDRFRRALADQQGPFVRAVLAGTDPRRRS